MVGYQGLVKRLNLPTGWTAPTELAYDDIRARALTRDHLCDDVQGINASLAYRRGYYTKLYSGLRQWIAASFPFPRVYYSNAETPTGP